MILVQMSGIPGSGKSTLSKQIAERTGAIILDHDIVKSALLNSIKDIPNDINIFGKIAYNIDWSLIEFHLSQGQNVVFDSPCLYQEMVDKGIGLAKKHNATYKYVECYLSDFNGVNYRLMNREKMVSQIREISSEAVFKNTIENSKRPKDHQCLVIDTGKPLESYINKVINYINE